MKEKQALEMNDNWRTGTDCPESATYCCEMHPYIDKYVQVGDVFPQCDQKNLPHNTTWHKLVNES